MAVAVSPGGKNVYAAGFATVALARTAGGALTPGRCIGGTGLLSAPRGCKRTRGLGGARDLAVSPDGRSVYVAAEELVVLTRRRSDGKLTASSTVGLNFAPSIVVSPDGRSVYVASGDDSAVVAFKRATKRRKASK